MINPNPTTLERPPVRLEPLTHAHHDDLAAAAADGALWQLWFTAVPLFAKLPSALSRDQVDRIVDQADATA